MDKVTGGHPFVGASARRPCVYCGGADHAGRAHDHMREALLKADAELRAGNTAEGLHWVGVARRVQYESEP